MTLDLAAIRAALDALPKAPWAVELEAHEVYIVVTEAAPNDDGWSSHAIACGVEEHTAIGIAALRNAAPALLDEIERYRARAPALARVVHAAIAWRVAGAEPAAQSAAVYDLLAALAALEAK